MLELSDCDTLKNNAVNKFKKTGDNNVFTLSETSVVATSKPDAQQCDSSTFDKNYDLKDLDQRLRQYQQKQKFNKKHLLRNSDL